MQNIKNTTNYGISASKQTHKTTRRLGITAAKQTHKTTRRLAQTCIAHHTSPAGSILTDLTNSKL